MIRKLRVKNFKCLRDVAVELQPLTVLIGKNDTGKTSFLEALFILAELTRGDARAFQGPWSVANLLSTDAADATIEWDVTVKATTRNRLPGDARYELSIGPGEGGLPSVTREKVEIEGASIRIERQRVGDAEELQIADGEEIRNIGGDWRTTTALSQGWRDRRLRNLNALARALTSTIKYQLDASQLRRPSALSPSDNAADWEPRLRHDGFGLPSVLDYLLGTRRSSFNVIESHLRDAAPFVKEVLIKPQSLADDPRVAKALFFRLTPGEQEVPAALMSDGVLLLLTYLTLVHGQQPAMLLVEEPENGIHPRLLERVVATLTRLASDTEAGAQVLTATHSPYLLDFAAPDSVLVFGRNQKGHTVLAPLVSLPGVAERLSGGLTLGEMWFNTGEDRLLAGVLGETTSDQ